MPPDAWRSPELRSVGLERGFASGQSLVVHGEEFLYTELRRSVDTTNIPRVVAFTKQHGAYVLPNLSAFEAMTLQWGKPEVLEEFLQRAEAQKLPPYWVNDWRARAYVQRRGSIAPQNAFLKKLTLALQRAAAARRRHAGPATITSSAWTSSLRNPS